MTQFFIVCNKKAGGSFVSGHQLGSIPTFFTTVANAKGVRTKMIGWKDVVEGQLEICPVTITVGEPVA